MIFWNTITPSFWPAQVDRTVIASAKRNSDILYVLANTHGVGMVGDNSFNSLWKYDASTSTWTDLINSLPDWEAPVSGYNSQTGYDMCLDVKPDDENFVIIGGLQDNGSHVDDESNKLSNWKTVGGGDVTYAAIADEVNYFYFSSQFANIYKQHS